MIVTEKSALDEVTRLFRATKWLTFLNEGGGHPFAAGGRLNDFVDRAKCQEDRKYI